MQLLPLGIIVLLPQSRVPWLIVGGTDTSHGSPACRGAAPKPGQGQQQFDGGVNACPAGLQSCGGWTATVDLPKTELGEEKHSPP